MDSAKTCGFLAAGCLLLLLTMLGDPIEACMCAPTHPQTAFCSADVVIRGKFVSYSKPSVNTTVEEPVSRVHYEIKTIKVYKGPEAVQEVRFLYTANAESLCGYEHTAPLQGQEYVITGHLHNNRVMISACSFIQPWAELSPEQRRGLSLDYSKGCSCNIVPCYSVPCSVSADSQCLWTNVIEDQNDIQVRSLACLPKSGNPNLCTWKSLNSQKSRFLRKAHLRQ